jgi:hypothetical protein
MHAHTGALNRLFRAIQKRDCLTNELKCKFMIFEKIMNFKRIILFNKKKIYLFKLK